MNPYLPGYHAFVQGTPYTPTYGSTGLPAPGGAAGMLTHALGYGPFMNAMQYQGWAPGGFHDQNLYDALTMQQFTRQHEEMLRRSTQHDQRSFMLAFRGMAHMAGTPWGAEQQRAAMQASGIMAGMAPTLTAMAPGFMDQLAGPHGSQPVMAHYMHLGGRYRTDILSGQMGMSGNTAQLVSTALFDQMYNRGDVGRWRGMTAGQAGEMYDEMQRRGMVGTAPRSHLEQMQASWMTGGLKSKTLEAIWERQGSRMTDGQRDINLQKMTVDDIKALQGDKDLQQQMAAIDATKIRQSLEKYSAAISAVKDIFGPQSPMKDLFAQLERLTGGNVSQLDPSKLHMIVRNTNNLARSAGLSLDQAMSMQGQAMAWAQGAGLHTALGITATQGSMAWGSAYRNGQANNQYQAWGMLSSEEAQQLDLQLRVAAGGSAGANQLGAVGRLNRAMGGFKEGTEAASLMAAIRGHRTEFINAAGKHESINVSSSRLQQIMSGVGVGAGTLNSYLMQRQDNQEMIHEYGIDNTMRRTQPAEAKAFAAAEFASTIRGRLIEAGFSPEEAATVAAKAGREAAEAAAAEADPGKRKLAMRKAMRGVIGKDRVNDQFLDVTADQALGGLTEAIGRTGWRSHKSAAGLFQMMNEGTLAAGEREQFRQGLISARQDVFAKIAPRGTLLSRVVGELQRAEGTNAKEMVAKAIGMVRAGDLGAGMTEGLARLKNAEVELKTLEEQAKAMPAGAARDAKLDEIEKKRALLESEGAKITAMATDNGLYMGNVNVGDTEATTQAIDYLSAYDEALAANDSEGDWKKFWGSKTGRSFRDQVGMIFSQTDTLAGAALKDEKLMARMGEAGITKAKRMMSINDEITTMAMEHTGGDVAKLLAGQGVALKFKNKALALQKEQRKIAAEMQAAMAGTGPKGPISAELRKKMEEASASSQEDQEKLADKLLRAYGVSDGYSADSETSQRIMAVLGRTGGRAAAEVMLKKADTLVDKETGLKIKGRDSTGRALAEAMEGLKLPTVRGESSQGSNAPAVSIPDGIVISGKLSFDDTGNLNLAGETNHVAGNT